MKSKSYALKPWWPRTPVNQPQPGVAATLPDRLALFRHRVALAAQLLDVSADTQARVVAAVDQILTTSDRPDIGSQAEQPAVIRRPTPRAIRTRQPAKPASSSFPRTPWPRPKPVTLKRENLVLHLRDQEHLPFKTIAKRLGSTREKIRQIYARALRRRCKSSTKTTIAVDFLCLCTRN
jgi:hypothetical protein